MGGWWRLGYDEAHFLAVVRSQSVPLDLMSCTGDHLLVSLPFNILHDRRAVLFLGISDVRFVCLSFAASCHGLNDSHRSLRTWRHSHLPQPQRPRREDTPTNERIRKYKMLFAPGRQAHL
jgi:hypothetical protein